MLNRKYSFFFKFTAKTELVKIFNIAMILIGWKCVRDIFF